jgi:hypothetical protein
MQYIFENYALIKYIHVITEENNTASHALLNSLHFKRDFEERYSKEHLFYLYERPAAQL